PNLVYFAARRAGLDRPFRRAVYQARWQEGKDIHKEATILQLAVDVGVDQEAASRALQDEETRHEAAKALMSAYDDDVFGVPFFICGFNKYWGVDRLPAFLDQLRPGVPRENLSLPVTDSTSFEAVNGDEDTAGGCG